MTATPVIGSYIQIIYVAGIGKAFCKELQYFANANTFVTQTALHK